MRILVTGGSGQLGSDIVKELTSRRIDCCSCSSESFGITDGDAVDNFFVDYRPDAVIHCAAYTCVDKAESDRENCYAVNVLGTQNIARACARLDAKLLYVSTDYVYGGSGTQLQAPGSPETPVNYYGYTKLMGEKAAAELCSKLFVVRTSWVFGLRGKNFVKTMLQLSRERERISVVSDQIGSPTFSADLASLICDMICTEKYGVYNVSNEGFCSWAEFAKEILQKSGSNAVVDCVTSEQYASAAHRPLNSRLSKQCLDDAGFRRLPTWNDALDRFMKEYRQKENEQL